MVKKTHRKDNKHDKEEISLDFGIGKLGLGGVFKGLEKFIELAERAEKAGGELKKSGTIKGLGGRKDLRGVYGFTVRTGLDKSPKFETFGNIKTTKKGPRVAETREPIVDVFDEKDHILVIAELPGIDESTIKLDLKKDILFLKAENSKRKYEKEILLPASVRGEARPNGRPAQVRGEARPNGRPAQVRGEARPNGRPAQVDFNSRKMQYKHGVLEIKFKKIKK